MISKEIHGKHLYFIDSEDPVVYYLKNEQLFGYHNWVVLSNFILDDDRDSYILDCGAHIGTFSFIPALFDNRKMILVDGATKNTDCLEKTFAGISNVEVHNKILLDSVKKCSFNSDYGPFGCAKDDDNGSRVSSTIDDIVSNRRISAIKLDIEGNESQAILGALKTLETNKPPMLIEVNGHCLRLQNKKPKDLFDTLDSIGYKYFLIDGQNLIDIEKEDIFPFCVIDIIAIHKDLMGRYSKTYNFSKPIPQFQLISIAKQGYENSNQDCKNYFDTLNILY